jgi:selenium-dependent xanthine dehydrogenase
VTEQTISLAVNGVVHQVQIDRRTTLLQVLRDQLGLTGAKDGCGQGQCGACTVIVAPANEGEPGEAVKSCTYLARRVAGKRVETIEGLAAGGRLHPLQQAFIDAGAIQCGFCTPGLIMATKALLDRNPYPTRAEICDALDKNLCRCTGYAKVIQAIQVVAEGRHLSSAGIKPGSPVGSSYTRPDAAAKATGALRYTADLTFPGMLHAKVLRSAHAHARLLAVDTSRARAHAGVVVVLTAADVPGAKNHGVSQNDWPVLAYDKVRYYGDAVALVVAETVEVAEKALGLIDVTYEPLPVADSPEAALAPGAPCVHDRGNVLKEIHVHKGDVAAGFALADQIVEETYRTPFGEHLFLEPEASVAVPEADGRLTVYVGSQIPFGDRSQVAASLAIPEAKVRIVHMPVGGAFGGKEDIAGQIHAALAARVTGRPVKLVWSRQESIITHPKRHATVIHARLGATADGRLVAAQVQILGDTGAYASLGEHVMTRAATHVTGPYAVPNVEVTCYALYTNNPPAGAYRGFGATQAQFVAELQIDRMAERLGLQPLEIRRRNALRAGWETCTGQLLRESAGLLECIDRVEQAVEGFRARDGGGEVPDRARGWGYACAYKNVGLGGGAIDSAGAEVEWLAGRVQVRAGAAEVGQGLLTVLSQIAADELGVSPQLVEVILGDTARTLDGGPTTASRQTFVTGNAVRQAAAQLRATLAAAASEALDAPPDALSFRDGRVWASSGRCLDLEQAARMAREEDRALCARAIYRPPATVSLGQEGDSHFAYGFAAQAAEVEVELSSGQVHVLRVITATDVGKAINPLAVEGQLEGGVMMGVGYALTEELVVDKGRVLSDSLVRYRVPTIRHLPEITPILVEHPTSSGPYGAKGIGEITSIPTAPAIVNAIYDAVGVRLSSLPAVLPLPLSKPAVRCDPKRGKVGGRV